MLFRNDSLNVHAQMRIKEIHVWKYIPIKSVIYSTKLG